MLEVIGQPIEFLEFENLAFTHTNNAEKAHTTPSVIPLLPKKTKVAPRFSTFQASLRERGFWAEWELTEIWEHN